MIKAVLFDCDGVLIDSYKSTIEYLQHTFKHFNLPIPPKESFLPLLGTKTPDIIRILQPQLTDKEFDDVHAFSMKQSLGIVDQISLMPHVKKVLTLLSHDYKLAVVSNRGRDSLHKILDNHQLSHFFEIILAREDVIRQKPDPDPIYKALDHLKVKGEHALFIGDTAIDAASAKSASISCIIYNSPDTSLGDYQISNLEEIPHIISKL